MLEMGLRASGPSPLGTIIINTHHSLNTLIYPKTYQPTPFIFFPLSFLLSADHYQHTQSPLYFHTHTTPFFSPPISVYDKTTGRTGGGW
ncbi:hypothetical protein Hanom_Chr02g00132681 [Helianthus anomalus]